LTSILHQPKRALAEETETRTIPHVPLILYRKAKHLEIINSYKGAKALNNNFISKIVAKWWKAESDSVKQYWSKKAEEEKRIHMEKYPDYKYRPKKTLMKQASLMNVTKVENRLQPLLAAPNRPSNLQILLPMSHQHQTPIAPAPQRIAPNYHFNIQSSIGLPDVHSHYHYDERDLPPTYTTNAHDDQRIDRMERMEHTWHNGTNGMNFA
jgi:hypothetical protein